MKPHECNVHAKAFARGSKLQNITALILESSLASLMNLKAFWQTFMPLMS